MAGLSKAHRIGSGLTSSIRPRQFSPGVQGLSLPSLKHPGSWRWVAMADVAVVGSGPNGLAAAVTMARAGLDVHLYEAADAIGGGTRTSELIEPGYLYDVCSAVHPMALASPFFKEFNLSQRIELRVPEVQHGTPLDVGGAALAYQSLERTTMELGVDG